MAKHRNRAVAAAAGETPRPKEERPNYPRSGNRHRPSLPPELTLPDPKLPPGRASVHAIVAAIKQSLNLDVFETRRVALLAQLDHWLDQNDADIDPELRQFLAAVRDDIIAAAPSHNANDIEG